MRSETITAGPGAEIDEEVEIITTIPERAKQPAVAAREDLVRWCLAHRLPVPEPRGSRWR